MILKSMVMLYWCYSQIRGELVWFIWLYDLFDHVHLGCSNGIGKEAGLFHRERIHQERYGQNRLILNRNTEEKWIRLIVVGIVSSDLFPNWKRKVAYSYMIATTNNPNGREPQLNSSWWRHQMVTFSTLLALCARNSPVTGEFPSQRPVMWSFDVFFDLHLNKRLNKQSWGWWFETP